MTGPDYDTVLTRRLWTMRIIVGSLVLGLLIFLGIVLAMKATGNQPPPPQMTILTWLGVGWSVLVVPISIVVPKYVSDAARRRLASVRYPEELAHPETAPTDPEVTGMWLGVYQTQLVIGSALLEGCGFFLLIAYLVEGTWLSLDLAVLLIVLVLGRMPMRGRVERWMERQRELLVQERTGM